MSDQENLHIKQGSNFGYGRVFRRVLSFHSPVQFHTKEDGSITKLLSANDKLLYSVLCNYADSQTGECYPSYSRLAEDCGTTERTVKKWMANLVLFGVVVRETNIRTSDRGKTFYGRNTYTVTHQINPQGTVLERDKYALIEGCGWCLIRQGGSVQTDRGVVSSGALGWCPDGHGGNEAPDTGVVSRKGVHNRPYQPTKITNQKEQQYPPYPPKGEDATASEIQGFDFENEEKEKNEKKEDTSSASDLFKKWYDDYSYKKDVRAAKRAWDKLDEEEKQLAIAYTPEYVKRTYKDDTYPSRRYPATYLNKKTWEDELPSLNDLETDNREKVLAYDLSDLTESQIARWQKFLDVCAKEDITVIYQLKKPLTPQELFSLTEKHRPEEIIQSLRKLNNHNRADVLFRSVHDTLLEWLNKAA